MALFLSLFLESLELPAGPRVKEIRSSKEGKAESTNLDSVLKFKRSAQGYKYPVPDNPLTFPTKTFSTTTPSATTDSKESATTLETSIVPNCIHEIEASIGRNPEFLDSGVPLCSSDEPVTGYEYPVPENPFTLPTKPTTPATTTTIQATTTTPATKTTTTNVPDCIPKEEASIGRNPEFLDLGVPLCPSDEPVAGYKYPVPENSLILPSKGDTGGDEVVGLNNFDYESGISIQRKGIIKIC